MQIMKWSSIDFFFMICMVHKSHPKRKKKLLMKAMLLKKIRPVSESSQPLEPAEVPIAEPGPGEIRIQAKEIKSVANITGQDVEAFLCLAADADITPTVETYPLTAANQALIELKSGKIRGAKVLLMEE